MSMCDNCIHDEVCGLECNHEESLVFCANMMVKNIFNNIITEIEALNPVDYVSMSSYEGHRGASDMKRDVLRIIDKYIEESE